MRVAAVAVSAGEISVPDMATFRVLLKTGCKLLAGNMEGC